MAASGRHIWDPVNHLEHRFFRKIVNDSNPLIIFAKNLVGNVKQGLIASLNPADNYMFKVNNRNNRTRCECSKLTVKTAEQHQWRRSFVFTVNFQHISHLVLVFLLLTLSR